MDEPLNEQRMIDIPKIFCASDTGQPLDHCLMCDKFLLDDSTTYVIEKAIKQHREINFAEPVFEYAMCMPCAMKMHSALSEESRMRIGSYFETNGRFQQRHQQLSEDAAVTIDSLVERCFIKNTPIADCPEYQLIAQCVGRKMIVDAMPFALSFSALEEMSTLLSAKSRDEMDDFIGKYFSGPPEVAAVLRRKLIFI